MIFKQSKVVWVEFTKRKIILGTLYINPIRFSDYNKPQNLNCIVTKLPQQAGSVLAGKGSTGREVVHSDHGQCFLDTSGWEIPAWQPHATTCALCLHAPFHLLPPPPATVIGPSKMCIITAYNHIKQYKQTIYFFIYTKTH